MREFKWFVDELKTLKLNAPAAARKAERILKRSVKDDLIRRLKKGRDIIEYCEPGNNAVEVIAAVTDNTVDKVIAEIAKYTNGDPTIRRPRTCKDSLQSQARYCKKALQSVEKNRCGNPLTPHERKALEDAIKALEDILKL